jgi:hypothetical protein
MARGVMGRVNDEALTAKLHGLDAQRRAEARAQHGKATGVSWRSAGSHKDENDIWRGGVAVGSYGEAALRESSVISDARGWGRYCGRVYQGKGGERLVVVVVYAPDSTYDEGDKTCGKYPQRLGGRVAPVSKGTTAPRWKPGAAMPVPTKEQVTHPKRLLMSDLELHLRHYETKFNFCVRNSNKPIFSFVVADLEISEK